MNSRINIVVTSFNNSRVYNIGITRARFHLINFVCCAVVTKLNIPVTFNILVTVYIYVKKKRKQRGGCVTY